MPIPSFYLGSVVRIVGKITTSTDSTVGADPTGLSFYLTEPDGTTYSYTYGGSTHINRSTGLSGYAGSPVYYVDWLAAKEKVHRGGWLGTGSNAGADEFSFGVIQRRY